MSTDTNTEALERAVGGRSVSNYPAIYMGFVEKGIAEADIRPRENVFTFAAWRAQGRTVRRGEHGVRIITWIRRAAPDAQDGDATGTTSRKRGGGAFPKSSVVFHISQTETLR